MGPGRWCAHLAFFFSQLIHPLVLLPAYDDLMKQPRGKQLVSNFDVVPRGDFWEVRDSDGRTVSSSSDQQTAVEFATIAAMAKQPSQVRWFDAKGLIVQKWNYPA